jgi:hypothetical protein
MTFKSQTLVRLDYIWNAENFERKLRTCGDAYKEETHYST